MEAELNQKENIVNNQQSQQQADQKKVKITFEEYQKLSIQICQTIKEMESEGQDSVAQGVIVNRIAQKMLEEESAATSIEKMSDIAKKIHHCITHLIKKENVLMVTQENKLNKNERLICMNINVDL